MEGLSFQGFPQQESGKVASQEAFVTEQGRAELSNELLEKHSSVPFTGTFFLPDGSTEGFSATGLDDAIDGARNHLASSPGNEVGVSLNFAVTRPTYPFQAALRVGTKVAS